MSVFFPIPQLYFLKAILLIFLEKETGEREREREIDDGFLFLLQKKKLLVISAVSVISFFPESFLLLSL
jgi:hypothetical protein